MIIRCRAEKNADYPKLPRDFPPRKDGIRLHPLGCLENPLPLPQSLYRQTDGRASGRTLTSEPKLPDFLTRGVPFARFVRVSSAMKEKCVIGIMRIESTTHRQANCSLLGYAMSRPHRLMKINAKQSRRRDPNQSGNIVRQTIIKLLFTSSESIEN